MLSIKKEIENEYHILVLQGEIDASNSVILDQAIQELIAEGSKYILVDGQGLDYISSAGLGVFMSYLEDFQEDNVKLKICSLSIQVFEVFKILGLDQLISIFPDRSTAIQA